ncbi:MAG: hypothetical protein ACYTAF_10310 [Planctomycetota bacterium]|jgi:hypothetical protein
MRISIVVAFLFLFSGAQDPQPSVHAKNCPASCEPCQAAVTKAFDFLIRSRNEDGCYGARHYLHGEYVAATSLVGLAFLAEGSTLEEGTYRKPLGECVDYILKFLPSPVWAQQKVVDTATHVNWGDCFAGLFLVEVHRGTKDKRLRAKIRKILGDISKRLTKHQLPEGGWSYGWNNCRYKKRKNLEGDLSVLGILALWSLSEIGREGVEVDPRTLEKAVKYVDRLIDHSGGIAYSLYHKDVLECGPEHYKTALKRRNRKEFSREELRASWRVFRSMMAIVAWSRLERPKRKQAREAADLMVRYMPHIYSHISFAGWEALFEPLACTQMGGKYPGVYRERMRDRILARQKDDGGFMGFVSPTSDAKITACALIGILAPLKKLSFASAPRSY